MGDGHISEATAQRARAASKEAYASIPQSLMELGLLDENTLFQALALFRDLPFYSPSQIVPAMVDAVDVPRDFQERAEVVVFEDDNRGLTLATSDPLDSEAADSISFLLKRPVTIAIAAPSTIKSALIEAASSENTVSDEASSADIERLTAMASEGPVIKLVNELIAQAVDAGASDIHIESGEASSQVRLRVDGVLIPHRTLPDATMASVASRLKVMARLNIAEKRRPQDGRMQISVRGRTVDIRLSTLPTQFGESVVLRLLDRSRVALDWNALGYDNERIQQIESAVSQPNGIFLVAGPTGSGKTTTLYTALNGINSPDKKIVTVEDPIEFSLSGVNQVQVQSQIDMSFAKALRSILRQDPDVIMVGEIRDEETAEIAIRAALVGRMVLSTIHTNDALSAVVRLRDLGVPPYLLAATLRGVLSQRLIRTLCSACKGAGCEGCNSTGNRGRTVISEFLDVTAQLNAGITRGAELDEMSAIAQSEGFSPMAQFARELAEHGIVRPEEVLRAVGEVHGLPTD